MGSTDVTISGKWIYTEIAPPPTVTAPENEPPAPPAETTPTEPPVSDPGTNPHTGEIPLEIIFLMWLVSSVVLIILGVFRKKILK